MYNGAQDHDGGTGLPKDHWIHKALSKEKSRLTKKKQGPAKMGDPDPTSPASVQATSGTPVKEGAPC